MILAVEHDYGMVADSEDHEHAIHVTVEVDSQPIPLWRDREGG